MTKPNIIIPNSFAANGDKTDFDESHITNGFPTLTPDVLRGDNLNKFIDDTYKGLNGVLELYKGTVLYDATETYSNTSIVFYIDTNDNNKIKIYHSLQNGNINHALTDTDYWEEVEFGGGANQDLSNLTDAGNAKLQYAPFAVNAGTGLSYSGSTLTCSACTITTVDGRTKEFSSSAILDVSTQADGIYYVFKDYVGGSLTLFKQPESWTQPVLSSNGTLGGSSFAVTQSSAYSGRNAYLAFNNNTSDFWTSAGSSYTANADGSTGSEYIIFYNPDKLNVSKLTFTNRSDSGRLDAPKSWSLYGSDDNSNWTLVGTYTNTNTVAGGTWSQDISGFYYNYGKILVNSINNTSTGECNIVEINITARLGVDGFNLDTSTVPASLYVNGSVNNDLVKLGTCTISSGSITGVTNVPINNRWQQALVQGHSVVETYQNGQSWYRVYDDGWCEQGGYTAVPASQYASAYFLKPYKDTNYTVTLSVYTPTSQYSYSSSVPVYVLATDYVQFRNNSATIEHDVRWFAAGYIS